MEKFTCLKLGNILPLTILIRAEISHAFLANHLSELKSSILLLAFFSEIEEAYNCK